MIMAALIAIILADTTRVGALAVTLCDPGENVVFTCTLQKEGRAVSICSKPGTAPPTSIVFRYGTRQRIEVSYDATIKNKRRFFANVLPANPMASIKELWFDLDGSRYVVTECVGARCSHVGGLIKYEKSGAVTAESCATLNLKEASFSPDFIDYGSDISDSSSFTELITLENTANDLDSLYPPEVTY